MAEDVEVHDNRAANRFELSIEGHMAVLDYERKDGAIVFTHTEVPEQFRGRGYGEQLVEAGVAAARAEGLRIVAVCPYVRAYLRTHPGGQTE
jgi:predicted GNAT family acetyltransferase